MNPAEEYRRAWDFGLGNHERQSTRVERFAHGLATFNEDYPRSYDHNSVWVPEPIPTVAGEELLRAADRLLGAARCRHRQVQLFDEADGERMRETFEGAGWTVQRHLCMAFHGELPPLTSIEAEQVGWEELRPTERTVISRQPYADSEETIRQLVERKGLLSSATHARHFVARVDGAIASMCDLYSDGLTAQVEDVHTLEEHRGGGLAKGVVSHAVRLAIEEGHDLVFLYADEDDWPREFYARLGFETIARSPELTKDPPDGSTPVAPSAPAPGASADESGSD